MKNKKILGLSLAAIGSIAVTATSFALHTYAAEDKAFDITVEENHVVDGQVTYHVGEVTKSTELALAPKEGQREITYTVPLSATFDSNVEAQTFIAGNLKLTVQSSETYVITAKLIGYDAYQYGRAIFGSKQLSDFTGENGQDITVCAAETQKLEIKVALAPEVTEANFIDHAEKPYNINVLWQGVTNAYKAPHVTGDANGWDVNDDAYRMVQNIGKESDTECEWMYEGLASMNVIKVYDSERTNVNEGYFGNSDGSNVKVAHDTQRATKVYYKNNVSNISNKGDGSIC